MKNVFCDSLSKQYWVLKNLSHLIFIVILLSFNSNISFAIGVYHVTDLGLVYPLRINDSSEVVGWYIDDSSNVNRPFYFTQANGMNKLSIFDGRTVIGRDINDAGSSQFCFPDGALIYYWLYE